MRQILQTALVLVALASSALAADWPQFQGPDRNGLSPETGLARSFGPQGPKVLWSAPLGTGFAGPAVHSGKVYILDREGDQQDVLRVFDLATGKPEWTFAYDAPGVVEKSFPGSRTTPSVDDQFVYLIGPLGHVTCVDKATRKAAWSTSLTAFGASKPNWGFAQSPVLYKDWVIVAPLSQTVGVVALEKATGKVAWQSAPIGGMDYASPQIVTLHGVDQVVMVGKKGKDTVAISGLDARDGRVLWTYDGWKCGIAIPCPTPIGDGRFFITGDYGAGCAMWKVDKQGEQFVVTELFKNKNCDSHIHNALLIDGRLYANSSKTGRGLVCLNLDGETLWQTDKQPDFDLGGNLISADGLIYILDGRSGTLYLVEARADGYKELGKAKLLEGDKVWAPMALSEGKLILRDHKQIKCVDVSGR